MTTTDYYLMPDKLTSSVTYGASILTIYFSFINQYAAAIGILIGIATFLLNWWFQWQKLKLEKAKLSKEELEKLDGDE